MSLKLVPGFVCGEPSADLHPLFVATLFPCPDLGPHTARSIGSPSFSAAERIPGPIGHVGCHRIESQRMKDLIFLRPRPVLRQRLLKREFPDLVGDDHNSE